MAEPQSVDGTFGLSSTTVVVTEEMLTSAILIGDLENLTIWAEQGVRVTSGEMLCVAARRGISAVVQILVREMGADVNQAMPDGETPLITATRMGNVSVVRLLVQELGADIDQGGQHGVTPLIMESSRGHLAAVRYLIELGARIEATANGGATALHMAASRGQLTVVRCLVELGAQVGAVDNDGDTTLLVSALNGRYATMQYLLEEAGANIDDVNNNGQTVWDTLMERLEDNGDDDDENPDPLALAGLLQVLVLRGTPPPALVALLLPEPTRVVQEGARLRARLPAYLVRRRALLDAHCPVLLPPLRALVHGYMELITTEEIWATGLGVAP
jgi:hypothetical protein